MEGLVQHTVNRILRIKGDEAKPPGTLCGLVVHHHDISDRPKGLEVLPEFVICQTGWQTPHEDLLSPSTTGVTSTATTTSSTSRVSSRARVHCLRSLLLLPRERTLHIDRAAVEGVWLQESGVDGGGVGVNYEAETPGAAGELVAHDRSLGDLAEGGEVLLQLLLRRLPRDAADEKLALVRLHLRLLAPLLGFARARVREGGDGRERGELGISASGADW